MSVFGFIDAVARTNLRDHAHVEALLKKRMQLADQNNYYTFFRLETVRLDANMRAINVELREPRPGTGSDSALLTMAIEGNCLTLEEVKPHFPELTVFDMPRGRSVNEMTTYEVGTQNTSVRLGFNQHTPACLAELSFEQ